MRSITAQERSSDRNFTKITYSLMSLRSKEYITCNRKFVSSPVDYVCPAGEKGEGMAVNSKQKGARFERQLAGLFRDYGYTEARRTAQYCGNTGDASDVVGLPGIHVEAKHQERMQLYDWMDQAKRDAKAGGAGMLPAVFSKKNNHSILVTMELDDWMKIYREFQAGMELKERVEDGKQEDV